MSDKAKELFDAAFSKARTPRSVAYKSGVLAELKFRLHGEGTVVLYPAGSAEFDAYYAGVEEGLAIYSKHLAGAA